MKRKVSIHFFACMEKHFELLDKEFELQFDSCQLDPTIFTHEAHLRLAWIHIKQHGLDRAIEIIQGQLIKFVDFVGRQDKYNETVTIAAIKAVGYFMRKSKSETFTGFIEEFPRLKNNFKELIAQHYSFDIYHSDRAKTTYVEPNLLPFD